MSNEQLYRPVSPVYFEPPEDMSAPPQISEPIHYPDNTNRATIWHKPVPVYSTPLVQQNKTNPMDNVNRINVMNRFPDIEYIGNDEESENEMLTNYGQMFDADPSNGPKKRTSLSLKTLSPIQRKVILTTKRKLLELQLKEIDENLKKINKESLTKRCFSTVGKVLKYPMYATVAYSGYSLLINSMSLLANNGDLTGVVLNTISETGVLQMLGKGLVASSALTGAKYMLKKSLDSV